MSDKNIDKDKDKLEIIDLLGMVKIFGLQEDFSQGVKDMVAENVKIKSELETYKKIAEILTANIYIPECKTCFKDCLKDEDCHKCIIDWARKEVENDES